MQLSLLTHLTEVRVLFIIGIVLTVLPIIFFILRKKTKIDYPKILTTSAGVMIVLGIVCFIPSIYYLYLDSEYDIGKYTSSDILYIAAESENSAAVEKMLDRGANPSEKTRFGKTAFFNSVEKGDYESVKIMAEHGADVNGPGKNGYTPLGIACRNGDTLMAQILLTRGADPDYKPDKYVSALTCAAAFDKGYNFELIDLLCAAGADKKATSRDSRGVKMVPFKYYFHKTIGVELSPEDKEAYDKIEELLGDAYSEWVMENADELFGTD